MRALAYNLFHMLRRFYVIGEGMRCSTEWLIRRLVKAGPGFPITQRSGTFTWPRSSRWCVTTGRCSAMADAGLLVVFGSEEMGAIRPEMGKAAFSLGFRKEEVLHMSVLTKLDELDLRNTA